MRRIKGFVSFIMVIVMSISFTIPSFASNVTGQTVAVNGYVFKVVEDGANTAKLSIVENNVEYVGIFDKQTNDITIVYTDNNSRARSAGSSIYKVSIDNYNYTSDSKLDGVSLTDEIGVSYDLGGRGRLTLPLGVAITEALLQALLAMMKALIIGGLAYVVAEEAVNNLKGYDYYKAILIGDEVFIGNGISRAEGLSIIAMNNATEGVFGRTDSYARGLVSGWGSFRGPEIHVSLGSGFWYHYHSLSYPKCHVWSPL